MIRLKRIIYLTAIMLFVLTSFSFAWEDKVGCKEHPMYKERRSSSYLFALYPPSPHESLYCFLKEYRNGELLMKGKVSGGC